MTAVALQYNRERMEFSINGAMLCGEKKMNSSWIVDLNVKYKALAESILMILE